MSVSRFQVNTPPVYHIFTNKTIEISLNKPHMDKFAVNFFIYTYIFLVPYVMLILAALTLCVLFFFYETFAEPWIQKIA